MNIQNISDYATIETYQGSKLVIQHRRRGDSPGITPPAHSPGLLEDMKIDASVSNLRRARLYTLATQAYLRGQLSGQDTWETWKGIVSQIGKINGVHSHKQIGRIR